MVAGQRDLRETCRACLVDDGASDPGTDAGPEQVTVFLPAAECRIIDTWHVTGLRGTGSHDIEVKDVFVPRERTYSLLSAKPYYDGPLYRANFINVFSPPVAAVALGIARAALDEFVALASGKMPMFTTTILREKLTVQAQVGRAEALVRSARALLFEVTENVWESMEAGRPLSEVAGWLRLLAVHDVVFVTVCALLFRSVVEE